MKYLKSKAIIIPALLVRVTYGEEANNLLNLMEENALKKYPWIMNESMDETIYSLDDFRRHGCHPWERMFQR